MRRAIKHMTILHTLRHEARSVIADAIKMVSWEFVLKIVTVWSAWFHDEADDEKEERRERGTRTMGTDSAALRRIKRSSSVRSVPGNECLCRSPSPSRVSETVFVCVRKSK